MQHSRRLLPPLLTVLFLLIGLLLIFHAGTARAVESGGSIWGADYFPYVPLITHEGKKVRFFTDVIKGKVVALNFIYTNCPDACALETARLREVQRILGNRVGRDVFLYSIAIARNTTLRRCSESTQINSGSSRVGCSSRGKTTTSS